MSYRQQKSYIERLDWSLIILFVILTLIGITAIYSVEHRETDTSFIMADKNYWKQLVWFGISLFIAFVILVMDSKFFTSVPFLGYLIGTVFLLLALTPLGKGVKGSHSWLNLGFFTFQPGELMKLFTALSIAKFLSLQEVNFQTMKHRLICAGIAIFPALIILLQNETGLALVYFSFFLAMYREGLPNIVLIIGFSIIALTLATLLIPKNILFILLTVLGLVFLYLQRRRLKRNKEILILVAGIWFVGVLFSQVIVPFAFKHVFQAHHIDRIYSLLGQEVPDEYIKVKKSGEKVRTGTSDYNVSQSKIAIASGGFLGKGYLNGTQTQYNWVPEQRTDFIFCTIGEQFGFWGSTVLIFLYTVFLLRMVHVAERQRSQFSRVYAYGVAGIMFFHLVINIGMTIGLAPVIGIPLPLVSYGGTSLMTFSILIFILIRLDADRQMVLR
ncbi:MAG: rod shape-determining protein RodA [Chitinophagaceae bacterium]|nr:rod shape-determining protein RodA [Chitinophagaceae bacterium]